MEDGSMIPDDPLFPRQWYLKNTGQFGGTPGIDINVEKVWDDYNGAGVTVGIYDDGVETVGPNAHPDLVANYDPALEPAINGSPNGQPVTVADNHGTAVAGIIAASTNNDLGVAGIAFGAKFGTVKFLGLPAGAPSEAALLGTLANFDVTNHSWGSTQAFSSNDPALFEAAAEDGREDLGTIIVKSAGNERLNDEGAIFRDANDEVLNVSRHSVVVAAILNTGFVTNYSTPGANLLVSAPAGPSATGLDQVLTTDRVGEFGYNPASVNIPFGQLDYTMFNGTSAAAPVVSGVVALMLQANPLLGWRDVQTILAYSARHVGSEIGAPAPVGNELNTWKFNNAVDWNGGGLHFSRDYGFGLVDAFAAVRLAETWNVGTPVPQTSNNEQSATDTETPGSTIAPDQTETVTFNISNAIRLEDAYLTLDLSFSDVSKLEITLESPGGTESEIWKGGGSEDELPEPWAFASREFFGESANANGGNWTLKITNNSTSDATLTDAALTAYGAADEGHTYVYTDEFDKFGDLPGRDTLAGSSGIDTLNAAAVTSNSLIDLVPGSSDTSIAGKTVTIELGNGPIENAIGGDGNDRLIGNTADNMLFGERGFDRLTGGAGNDTIDGGRDGSLAVYSGPHPDYQVTQNADGSLVWTVSDQRTGAPDGIDTLSHVQFLQFTDTNIDLRAVRNFDALHRSDFAWQNDSGQPALWLLDGTNITFNGAAGSFNPGPSWQIESTGDFNADDNADFIWQGQDGTPSMWLMDGASATFAGAVGPFNPGPSWHIKATGDFNDDVNSDILWQNDSGQPAIWLMDGTNVTFNSAVGPFNPGPSWQIKGTGDFNGDTNSDIIWQGQDGTPAIWLMDNTNVTFAGVVGPFNPGPSWHIKGTGDFNGDGKSDILWQGDDGTPAIWLMDGTTVTALGAVGSNPGASWHVVGAGQFNNDLKSDILWQSDSGQAAVWLMDGMNVIGNTGVGGNPGADWHLIA
jgi:subtilisin-like proprotein convertase family protein